MQTQWPVPVAQRSQTINRCRNHQPAWFRRRVKRRALAMNKLQAQSGKLIFIIPIFFGCVRLSYISLFYFLHA